jgi:hypothetical protein
MQGVVSREEYSQMLSETHFEFTVPVNFTGKFLILKKNLLFLKKRI